MQRSAQHIFSDHLLPVEHPAPLAAPPDGPAWIPLYLITCLVLLVLVKSTALPRLVRMFQSTFSSQILQQLEREEVNLFRSYTLALNVLFVLNVAFLVFKLNQAEQYVLEGAASFRQFLFFAAAIVLVMAFKLAMNRLLVAFTGERKIVNDYMVSSNLVNQTFGLILFPCLILLQFSHMFPAAFLFMAVLVLALSVLLRWYRGLLMGIVEQRLGFLQIFSYFCALEILPVLVLVKYVIETF